MKTCRLDEVISIHAPRTGSDGAQFQPAGKSLRFQSTLPARGATRRLPNQAGLCARISIHAPRTGSDLADRQARIRIDHFNPRSPHGERRDDDSCMVGSTQFQSTLPARGATNRANQRPRAVDFNPRSPHGERRR